MLDPEREQRPSEGLHHLFSGESHVVFVELPDSDRTAKCVDELDSFGEKPAKTPRIWNVVDCFLVGSTASPNHYAWYLATAFKPLKKAGVGVAPGVYFGEAGKRAEGFSYALSEEETHPSPGMISLLRLLTRT